MTHKLYTVGILIKNLKSVGLGDMKRVNKIKMLYVAIKKDKRVKSA